MPIIREQKDRKRRKRFPILAAHKINFCIARIVLNSKLVLRMAIYTDKRRLGNDQSHNGALMDTVIMHRCNTIAPLHTECKHMISLFLVLRQRELSITVGDANMTFGIYNTEMWLNERNSKPWLHTAMI